MQKLWSFCEHIFIRYFFLNFKIIIFLLKLNLLKTKNTSSHPRINAGNNNINSHSHRREHFRNLFIYSQFHLSPSRSLLLLHTRFIFPFTRWTFYLFFFSTHKESFKRYFLETLRRWWKNHSSHAFSFLSAFLGLMRKFLCLLKKLSDVSTAA